MDRSFRALRWLVVRNTAWQLAAQGVFVALGVATTVVVSRHLGVAGFGHFSYVFAFLYFFQVLNDLALTTIVVREVARAPERAGHLVSAVVTFKLLLALVSVVAAWAVAWSLRLPAPVRAASGVFALCLPLWALQVPMVLFQVRLDAASPAIIGMVSRLVGVALVMLVVWRGGMLVSLFAAFVAAEVLSTALVLAGTRRIVSLRWTMDVDLWKRLLWASLPLGLATWFGAVTSRADFFMLERLAGAHQLGLYAAAYKVTNLLEALPLAVMGTLFPVMAGWSERDPVRLRRTYVRASLYLMGLALVAIALVSVSAGGLVRLLFGEKFVAAAGALRVLVWATGCLYVAVVGGNLLIALGRERVSLALNASAATINVALNLWLIPALGAVGAAAATVAAYALLLVGTTVSAARALAAGADGRVPAAGAAAPRAGVESPEGGGVAVPSAGTPW